LSTYYPSRPTIENAVCSTLFFLFFFNAPSTTEIYTLSLHDALPISTTWFRAGCRPGDLAGHHLRFLRAHYSHAGQRPSEDQAHQDRKSTRLNSSHVSISYAVFCLKKKKKNKKIILS